MSKKTTVICCVVGLICFALGMFALQFLSHTVGVVLMLVAVFVLAAVLGTHVQCAMESMIENEIEHRRRVNEIYEMLKDGKEKSEDRRDDEQ